MQQVRGMLRVLVVGAGPTGAVTAALLRDRLDEHTAHITVWDKARKAGGRMTTSSSPRSAHSTVDIGAQYVSPTPDAYQKHKILFEDLLSHRVLTVLSGKIENDSYAAEGVTHYTAPQGTGSIVTHFLNKAGADVKFSQHLKELKLCDGGVKWQVSTEDGSSEKFDCVILTMPVPQVLQIAGSLPNVLSSQPDVKDKLEKVVYSCRFAMGLFYKPGTVIDLPWCAKYIDDDCVRYIAIDNKKRGIDSTDTGPSVIVHTSVPFGIKHLEEDKETICNNIILPKVKTMFPELADPVATKCHKWRYSQVYKAYAGHPGCISFQQPALLVCGGDAFTAGKFDGCLDSSKAIVERVSSEILKPAL